MNRPYIFFLLISLFVGCSDTASPSLPSIGDKMDEIWKSNSDEYMKYIVEGGLTDKDCLMILVDCSGSMKGDRLKKAKDALLAYLNTLDDTKTVFFYTMYHSAIQRSYKLTLDQMRARIVDLNADGGTPLGTALEVLHGDGVNLEGKYRYITALIITDGQCDGVQVPDMEMAAIRMIRSRMFLDVVGYDMGNEVHSLSKYASRYRTADQATLTNVLLEKE